MSIAKKIISLFILKEKKRKKENPKRTPSKLRQGGAKRAGANKERTSGEPSTPRPKEYPHDGGRSSPSHQEQPRQKSGRRLNTRAHSEQRNRSQPPKCRTTEYAPWVLSDFNVEPQEGRIRFHDLNLHPKLMRSIHMLGWRYTTPIQGEILPDALKGRDMAGRAQTGTGKTAAFLISIINHCLNNPLPRHCTGNPRALIIAPTRELALQIGKDSDSLNRFTGLRTVALYGGMDYNKQQRGLENERVDVIVATPGRLLDFEGKKVVQLRYTEVLVIDEADRMLDMGFIPDVRRIIHKTPPKEKRQTLLFSATLADEVMQLAATWMTNPERIDIEPKQVAVDTVDQKVYIVTDDQKFQLLYNIIKTDRPERIIIFTNRRDQAERLSDDLTRFGHRNEMLSGAVTQKNRVRILEEFRAGKTTVLVATDVAGRGIHVEGVSHVVNFNIPENPDDYVHRIGRTGRAGATGQSITFACEMESFELPKIEKLLGMALKCTTPPETLFEELPTAARKKRAPHSRSPGGGRRTASRRAAPREKRFMAGKSLPPR